jgi:hypothetical protein
MEETIFRRDAEKRTPEARAPQLRRTREKSRIKKLGQSVEQAENRKKSHAGRGLETTWEINQYE